MHRAPFPDDFYEREKPRLHRRIGRELRLARHVLDIGCGACELALFLARRYHQEVTGVDLSGEGFPRSLRPKGAGRLRCIRKDAKRLDFVKDEAMDAVVSMWSLHEMAHPLEVMQESWRVLRPGGEVLIVDFPRDSLAQRLWNEDYLSPGEVAGLLEKAHFVEVAARLNARGQVLWAKAYRPEAEPVRAKGMRRHT
ncbi:MAG: class I SAM-dependent methyltransferase [Candidatus Hydrogenedentes bacterium]|nr:class I SAM-dependent methyltransferase [Candidatus Hydrogenedentota bacterium]